MAWWFWAGIIVVMNVLTFRQEQAPQYPELPVSRWLLAVLAVILLALTFTVSPFQINLEIRAALCCENSSRLRYSIVLIMWIRP